VLELLIDHPKRKCDKTRLLDLPPMSVGVQPIIAGHDLAFVGNLRGHPGADNHRQDLSGEDFDRT